MYKIRENSAQPFTIKATNQNHELSLNSDVLNLRKCSNAYRGKKKKTPGILKQTVILQLLLNITGKCLQPRYDKNFI